MTTFSRFLTKLLGFFFRNITFFLFSFGLSNPFLPLIVWLFLLLLLPALEFELFITNVSFTFFISLSCGDNSFRPGFSVGLGPLLEDSLKPFFFLPCFLL